MERIVIWMVIIAISLITEGLTMALVSIWFVPSAAICLILELVGVKNIYIQIAVFIVLSALFAFFLRGKLKQSLRGSSKTNVDALVGKTAVVEEDIPEGGVGRARIGGMSWAAFTEENRSVLAGEKVRITEIIGVKLLCVPLMSEPSNPAEELIGKQARVERRIDNFEASGTVICDGKAYRAKSADNEVIDENAVVTICAVDGEKVICKTKEF